MASIRYSDLVDLIRSHPKYKTDWEQGVPVETALYISFSDQKPQSVTSNVLSTSIGKELVLDMLDEESVAGVEII